MLKNLAYALPALLLIGCGETPERYRDTHQLELPPVLPIEHTHQQTAVAPDDMKPRTSALAGLISFEEVEGKPRLTLKTRPERAWEMVTTALKISNIEVLDKNRDVDVFVVHYDPDSATKEDTFLNSLFGNDYAEASYTITLKEGILGIAVNAALTKPEDLEYGDDGSDVLIRHLYKVINDKIINRDPRKSGEGE